MVDCSHANSDKDPKLQPLVMADVANQIAEGNQSIVGLMIESNINWGNQKIPENLNKLEYGVSVTDACVDWETTENMIGELRERVKEILPNRELC
jgi:3-deoxy-7-phosphoheptulonate synthase